VNHRIASFFPILALAAGATLVACGDHREPAAEFELAPVRAALASAERVDAPASIELSGTLEPARATSVASRVIALVTAVHARLGDRVAAGQTLISIDPTTAQGQVSQAEGALAQASAALALAERNHARFEALAEKEAASELELDLARMQHEQARGAVDQARGAVEAARAVARESRVVAPYAGRVAGRWVEVGDLAAPGRPLMQIESEGGARLVVAVPERAALAASLAVGEHLPVTLDARPELGELDGEVVELSPGPDPVTHAFTAKIALRDVDAPAGAAGRAILAAGTRTTVLVPAAARIASGGLELVVVRDDEGRARSRAVTFGRAVADGRLEVLSGLDGGETVALGLAAAPRAGSPIEATEPAR